MVNKLSTAKYLYVYSVYNSVLVDAGLTTIEFREAISIVMQLLSAQVLVSNRN